MLHKAEISLRYDFMLTVYRQKVAHLDVSIHALGDQRYWVS